MKIAKALRDKTDSALETGAKDREFRVVVEYHGAFEDLDIGDIPLHPTLSGPARGWLTVAQISALAELDAILLIDEPEQHYLTLNDTVPHIKANLAWALQTSPALKGRGVAVAVIDSGIDVLHESFQDGSGNTRILALWDQTFRYDSTSGIAVDGSGTAITGTDIPTDEMGNVVSSASNRAPSAHPTMSGNAVNPALAAMDFGMEFTRAQINTALTRHRNDGQAIPISLRDDPASDNHGTHVAGIAAGDGSQSGNCRGGDTFVGVAPEADLIIVKVGFNGRIQDIGAATEYALVKARSVSTGAMPVSVNLSLGSHFGPHNGFSSGAIEVQNFLSGTTGEVITYAAGNERNDAIHAAVAVPAGGDFALDFFVNRDTSQSVFWMSFAPGSAFNYDLQLPPDTNGARAQTAAIDITSTATLASNGLNFQSEVRAPRTGDLDNHAVLAISSTAAGGVVTPGNWRLNIHNTGASTLNLHIWSTSRETNFILSGGLPASTQNPAQPENWLKGTVGTTANGADVLTVAAYDIGGGGRSIAGFSSQGPAPLGLANGLYPATSPAKPDIAAPGVGVTSAKAEAFDCFLMCECCVSNYMDMAGTSQAAPHIAGVAALMLQADPTLTHTQIKDMLRNNATAPPPLDAGWPPASELFGAGTVDAQSAVQAVIDNLGTSREAATEIARAATQEFRVPLYARAAEVLRDWETRFGARPAWHFFAGLVSTHFVEVQRLINTQRKVGAVWQRHGGPALIRSVVFGERDIDPPIPVAVGAKRMDTLVRRFIPVLGRFSGPELTADIARYRQLAQKLPGRRIDEIDALVEGLSA